MAKRLKKSEKLDLILSEVLKLKAEMSKLAKQQADFLTETRGPKARKAETRTKPAKAKKASSRPKTAAPAKPVKSAPARKIPVLVQNSTPPQAVSGGS